MDFDNIKQAAEDLIGKGKAAIDADGDGAVEASEVLDAIKGRFVETGEAIKEAAGAVKEGFDAAADGKVEADELRAVAEGIGKKAKDAIDDLLDKD